jgi:hypothetical protein
MNECEYNQEDFCIFQDVEGFAYPCRFKDKDNHCTAKPDDLVSVCEMCGSEDCYNEECLEETSVNQKEKAKQP